MKVEAEKSQVTRTTTIRCVGTNATRVMLGMGGVWICALRPYHGRARNVVEVREGVCVDRGEREAEICVVGVSGNRL
jgi:hypothetical protein